MMKNAITGHTPQPPRLFLTLLLICTVAACGGGGGGGGEEEDSASAQPPPTPQQQQLPTAQQQPPPPQQQPPQQQPPTMPVAPAPQPVTMPVVVPPVVVPPVTMPVAPQPMPMPSTEAVAVTPPAMAYANATGALLSFLQNNGGQVPLTQTQYTLAAGGGLTAPTPIASASANTYRPARDTGAEAAWRDGWTGAGVGVAHLDDFNRDTVRLSGATPVTHGEATRFVTLQIAPEINLPPNPSVNSQLTFFCTANQELQINTAFRYFEDNDFHIVNNSWGTNRYSGMRVGCDGLGGGLEGDDRWNGFIADARADAANRALALPTSTTNAAYDDMMLFIFSAGNGYERCNGTVSSGIAVAFTGLLSECNLLAATIKSFRETDGVAEAGERVLFVGALSDASVSLAPANRVLADYSHPAGADFADDYIVAHDDIYSSGDAAGTSYSAPRVAGAAALVRQKWPTLDGSGLKQVLIQSATDLGAAGPDPIFGAGQLNISGALSPIGGLTR